MALSKAKRLPKQSSNQKNNLYNRLKDLYQAAIFAIICSILKTKKASLS